MCVCVLHVCGNCVSGYMWIGGLDGCEKGAHHHAAHHHACMRVRACVRGVCAHVVAANHHLQLLPLLQNTDVLLR